MKLSVMSYTIARTGWFKENQAEGLKKICKLTRDLNLDGIDWVTTYGIDPHEIRKVMDDNGLKTVCYTNPASGLNAATCAERCAGVDTARETIETAVALGTDKVMLVTPGKRDVPRDISRKNYIRGLQECAGLARQAGITITIENFPGADSPFVISSDVQEAFREVPGLKLTYDNGNIALGGEDPAVSFARCADRVVHAHFKDWDRLPAGEGREALDGRCYASALIGEGIIDHKSCLAAMKAAGYAGYINIEYENNKYPADEATGRAVKYLRGLMQELDK